MYDKRTGYHKKNCKIDLDITFKLLFSPRNILIFKPTITYKS